MDMRTRHLDMTESNSNEQLRDLIKDIDFAMLTTWDGRFMHSRPMSTQAAEADGELWFFTRRQSGKVEEIETYDKVNVAYSDVKNQRYVSVSGRGEVLVDHAKAIELWSPHVRAWFDGPTDPDLCLVRVVVEAAEYWGADGKPRGVSGLMRPAIMGHPYPPGDSVELTVSKAQLSNAERRI